MDTTSRPQGFIFDIDGTILRGHQALPGAAETIGELRRRGHPLVFVSNALEMPDEQAARLAIAGVSIAPEEIITAPQMLIDYLTRHMPGATLYVISDPPLKENLGRTFIISDVPAEIEAVVVSCDHQFDFHKLNIGFQALRRGARFLAVNADPICPLPDGVIPDAGAIIGALEGCSKRKLELVCGKPSKMITEAALKWLDRTAQECIIVGDNPESDIDMGHQNGMKTILVLSGVTRPEDLSNISIRPDHILENINAISRLLNEISK